MNYFADAVRAPRFYNYAQSQSQNCRSRPAQSTVAVTTVFDRLQFLVMDNNETGNNEAGN